RLVEYRSWQQDQGRGQARIAEGEPGAARVARFSELRSGWGPYRDPEKGWERGREQRDGGPTQSPGGGKGQGGLTGLRSMVKGHLVPALSRVASHLLAQMTGGQRSAIVVDQEFDVLVDGQRLDTLSGSGKALANLALRLGLGQVLTNNVLSLFIGDEI